MSQREAQMLRALWRRIRTEHHLGGAPIRHGDAVTVTKE
jgi:hypothetical protein